MVNERTAAEQEEQEVEELAKAIGKRQDAARRDLIRRSVGGALRDVGTAISVLPQDLAIGDVVYAAGEALHPEGSAGAALTALGTGLTTGGVGSGALAARGVKAAAAKVGKKGSKYDIEELERVLRSRPLKRAPKGIKLEKPPTFEQIERQKMVLEALDRAATAGARRGGPSLISEVIEEEMRGRREEAEAVKPTRVGAGRLAVPEEM